MNQVLVIGSVWPEPNSSAAGSRMMQLLELFVSFDWKVTFASSAVDSLHMADVTSLGVDKVNILLNDSSFDDFITELKPSIVVFDRFMTEEQYGWRVVERMPNALRILNTEDIHSLRRSRQEHFKSKKEFKIEKLLNSDIAKREIASIYRCDISLIISSYEMKLLKEVFKIDKSILFHLPFLLDSITLDVIKDWPDYEERNHFIAIGNFRHEPNWNSILYLKESIWPLIRKMLPETELHVYGAYPPPKATQLHDVKEGFLVKGWVTNAQEVMKKAKICLAPLRFGAGIKGKLTEAMLCGTPSVTTTIGAEGMSGNINWNGSITDEPSVFAQQAVELYRNKNSWLIAQNNGVKIINTQYQKKELGTLFFKNITEMQSNLSNHRARNFIGSMLQYHTIRSTMYMSKWIEEKNKLLK